MNTFVRFLTCAIVLLMALAVLPASSMVSADTENEFGDGTAEKTMTFTGKGSNDEATIVLPAEADVSNARLTISGDENGGTFPYHPSFLVNEGSGQRVWDFNGTAYGQLGQQTVFTDNGSSAAISFGGEEEKIRSINLPKNATVTSATVDISGRRSSGTMTIPDTVSEDTLITSSIGAAPSVVTEGSNVYVAWIDNGDLNYAKKDQDIFFKKSTDDGQSWSKAIRLSDTDVLSYAPSLAVNGDEVYAAWSEGTTPYFRMSSDGGDTWATTVRLKGTANNNPVVSAAGSYVYLVWMTLENLESSYRVYFTRSNNGVDWDEPKIISGEEGGREVNSRSPWIASYGNDVYVVWYETDGDGNYFIYFKHSSDSGGNFPKSSTEIETGTDLMDTPKIACNENGRIYVTWLKGSSFIQENDLYYSYSTNNGNDGSWSEPSVIDDTDEYIYGTSLSSERENGVNYVYVAWEDLNNLTFRRSTNEVTWSGSQRIMVNSGYSPSITANDDGHVYIASYLNNRTDQYTNTDVYVNLSDDRGSNWDDGTLISREQFDGDSMYPEMIVDGDEIYIVWVERGNITGIENGVDQDILFRYFDGANWDDIQVLSNHAEDEYSQWPAIAVDGNNVYVVWQEVDSSNSGTDDTDNDIVVRYSSNKGTSWGPVRVVSDDANDGESWYPRVSANGNNGFVVWRDSGNIGGSGADTDICFRSIASGLPQGSTTVISTDTEDRSSDRPDIFADGSTIHVVWHDNGNIGGSGTDYDIIYRQSTNSGNSWGDHVVVSQTATSSYEPQISVGDYIYVLWRENYPTFSRSANGNAGTWSAQYRISTHLGYDMDIDSLDENIVISYQYSVGIYVSGSTDAGDNWEEPVDVTTEDSQTVDYPVTEIGDDEIHVVYQDNGNVSGNGWDYDIIHRKSVDSNPSNVELDVGNDGDVDWTKSGELNDGNSPQTFSGSSFVNELNDALDSAKSFMDWANNEIATIDLRITSDTAGLVILDNLAIEYDYEARTPDFSDFVNDYLEDHQDEMDGDGNIEIPLTVTSDTAGEITVFDLFVEYELTKALFLSTPEKDGMYTTNIDITWTAKNFESGDDVEISYYDGNWHTLDTVPANDESWPGWDTSSMIDPNFKVKIEYVDDTDIMDDSGYFMIDNYDPQTTHSFNYKGQYVDGETVYGREVTITLKPDDDFDGGDSGSGVNHTYYRIDGGEWVEYSDPFSINEHGDHTFDYYSVDMLGNTETEIQGLVHIDGIDPELDDWVIPDLRYDSEQTVSVSVTVADHETGIDEEATIHNKLQYALGDELQQTRYQNWQNLDNRDLSGGVYSGELTEDWLALTDEHGSFRVWLKCTIADNVGNTNTSEFFEAVDGDIFPPTILSVSSEVDDDKDDTYFVGSQVILVITSDEEELNGSVSITGGAPGNGPFNTDLIRDGTTYWASWDTTNINPKTYTVRFMLEDDKGNENMTDSLVIAIQDLLNPELSVTGIAVEQNGIQGNIAEQVETNINISVYNSGTLAVTGVSLSVYEDEKTTGNRIALLSVDLNAGEAKTVTVKWTPVITENSVDIDIIAEIELLEGETIDSNNEESVEVTVNKISDFTVLSVKIQDSKGSDISKATERDSIQIVADVQNIGDVQATMTVSAYYSGSTRIASDSTVTIPAGGSKTVTLTWASAVKGVHTITVRADPGQQIVEKNEDNNEATAQLEVKEASTSGGTSEEEGIPTFMIALILIVVVGGIGGAAFFLKSQSDDDDDWGASSSGSEAGWDDAPAAPAPRPKPRPKPVQKEAPVEKPKPAPKEAAAAGAAAGAAVAAVKVKCPKCQTILSLKTTQRPVTIKCPKCETKLTLKE